MSEPYVKFRAKTNDRLDKVETRLTDAEERLRGHDEEIAEIDSDILILSEVCLRTSKRIAARRKLRKISRRRSE